MKETVAEKCPELATQWSNRNLPMTPADVTIGSHKRAWWRGSCGHEWQAIVKNRVNGADCPYCNSNQLLKGFNDLATMKPELVSEWSEKNYSLMPDMVLSCTNKSVWWKCIHGHEWIAMDLLFGVACGVGFRLIVYFKAKNAKKFRHGVEYGSARWGNAKDIEPYMDPVFENNIILTASERLMMSGRPSSPKYARNKNILVIGGSGSGKTRFFVKPNLMQMHSSYVVTDPKGTVLVECGRMLKKGIPLLDDNGAVVKDDKGKTVYQPYKIKVLNTINFARSMHYNPFAYIRSEKDILKLVNTIIVNTKGEDQQSGEDFWVKAEKLLYTAYIGFIWYEAPEKEQNFSMLIDMIDASEAREDDESFKNPVDLLFDELEAEKPNHFAVRQYKKYKLAAGVATCNPLDGKMICHDCGSLMYCHRTSNGKKVAQYVCAKYGERDRKGFVQTTQKIDIYFNFIGNYSMPEKELTEVEKAEIERMNAIKDKRHEQYLARKARGSQQKWEKAYEPRRKARIAQLKADNTNTYGIPAEEYDQEHYSKVSVVLADSVVPDF